MEKWVISNKSAGYMEFVDHFGISPSFAVLLKNRGLKTIEEAEKYLNGTLKDMRNPALLPDIDTAVFKLFSSIEEGRKIRIIGDYDVDGVCSTYILYAALTEFGADVSFYIPHRVNDGYGINNSIIDNAKADGIGLIITCDNGISAIECVAYANSLGMEVIVTDHHEPITEEQDGEIIDVLPKAKAVVDPKRKESMYGFDGICGAVVAYKFVLRCAEVNNIHLKESLNNDFVAFAALATVCDVMELQDENRVLVKSGLENILKVNNLGLKTLINLVLPGAKSITTYHCGFVIGPCLNAAGRLDTADLAMELLLSRDEYKAMETAKKLMELNEDRKGITEQGVTDACSYIEENGLLNDKIIVVKTSVFEAVCGIIAGRLKEKYHKPVFVFANSNGILKGSGRSIDEYDMYDGLLKNKDILLKFGGHKLAAGVSIEEERLEEFRKAVNETSSLKEEDFYGKVLIDLELRLPGADISLANEIKRLEPMGNGNKAPLFATRNIILKSARVIGKDGRHLKLIASEAGEYEKYEIMLWGKKEEFDSYYSGKYSAEDLSDLYLGKGSKTLTFTYELELNEYNGIIKPQIIMKHFI